MSHCISRLRKHAMNNWWQWGERVRNLLGRAIRRDRIKNKDQTLVGSGGNPAPALLLLSPSQVFLLLSHTFPPLECSEMRGRQEKQCFKSLQSKGKRQGPPRRAAGQGLREQAEHGNMAVPLLGRSPIQSWEPSVSLESQLVRLVWWEFSKSTPCYSGSFGAHKHTAWNVWQKPPHSLHTKVLVCQMLTFLICKYYHLSCMKVQYLGV